MGSDDPGRPGGILVGGSTALAYWWDAEYELRRGSPNCLISSVRSTGFFKLSASKRQQATRMRWMWHQSERGRSRGLFWRRSNGTRLPLEPYAASFGQSSLVSNDRPKRDRAAEMMPRIHIRL